MIRETSEHIRNILAVIPEKPGCYQYFDEKGTIIYVGKAKNLKRRVSSYFTKEHDNNKTRVLVKQIRDLKYVVVDTEEDALLLENNLIKQYRPRYNVLLKDDKTYPRLWSRMNTFHASIRPARLYGTVPLIMAPTLRFIQLASCYNWLRISIRFVPVNMH